MKFKAYPRDDSAKRRQLNQQLSSVSVVKQTCKLPNNALSPRFIVHLYLYKHIIFATTLHRANGNNINRQQTDNKPTTTAAAARQLKPVCPLGTFWNLPKRGFTSSSHFVA